MQIHSILKKEYPWRTEMHAHTFPASPCADFSPEEAVRSYTAIGCDSLVISNHLTADICSGYSADEYAEIYLSDYYRAKKAAEGSKVDIILAAELRFSENHNDYIIFGISPDDIPTLIASIPLGIEKFYKSFKNNKNLIIQAHPFRKKSQIAPIDSIDGIESMNMHPEHNSKVGLSAKFAKENSLLVTCGTDYHHANHEGICLLRTKSKITNSYELVETLNKKDYIFDLSEHFIIPYFEE